MIYKAGVSDILKDLIRVLPLLPDSFSVSVQLGFTVARLSFSCLSSLLVFCHSERCWMGSEVWRTEVRLSHTRAHFHTHIHSHHYKHTHTLPISSFLSLSLSFFMNLNAREWNNTSCSSLKDPFCSKLTPESQNHVSID